MFSLSRPKKIFRRLVMKCFWILNMNSAMSVLLQGIGLKQNLFQNRQMETVP